MASIATFKTTKGTKTWEVTPSRIMDLDGFSSAFELNAEDNTAVEGSPLSNQRGMKKKVVTFSSNLNAALGVNVRDEFESWESWIGLAGVLKIGGKRFGSCSWLLTSVKPSNVKIDSNGRFRAMKLAFSFEQSDDTSVDDAEAVAAAVASARSAASVTASQSDKNAKKATNSQMAASTQTPAATSAIVIGDIVQFKGGPHYVSSTATSYKTSPPAGPAKVTAIAKSAKHPYHVIHTTSASYVYGWVDASQISKPTVAKPGAGNGPVAMVK